MRSKEDTVIPNYRLRMKAADDRWFPGAAQRPFNTMLEALPPVQGFVVGMFGEFSPALERLAKFTGVQTAEAWAERTGLQAEEAISACSWSIRRRWGFTALRECARIRLAAADHVRYGEVSARARQSTRAAFTAFQTSRVRKFWRPASTASASSRRV